ncbi:MAG: phosphoenolpyruvate--protein phosphotransferase [Desulfobacterales bacterium]|nr:MAG: phosphoenolpyruvate--protein phosphotransferase [Desulfobacterales bacterium]
MAKRVLTGISVSSGIAIGRAFFLNKNRMAQAPRQTIPQDMVDKEQQRLQTAILLAQEELERIRANVPRELQEHGALIDSYLMILKDRKLGDKARQYLVQLRINAEWALEKAVADIETMFNAIDDDYIRARMQDVRLVSQRVMNQLAGQDHDITGVRSRVILMAHDLTAADTIELEVNKIMAFATAMGGKTSHAGILARSLQIPAVVGVDELEGIMGDDEIVILDGFNGRILIQPTEDELRDYTELQYRFEDYQRSLSRVSHLPGETRDGYRVNVLANIELFEEVTSVLDYGGEGIGLYRTEYNYMNRTSFPTEEEMVEIYTDLADIMAPAKVVLRTLDLGADKVSFFGSLEEANPAMGLRAVRFCLSHKEIFRTQLRAMMRAGSKGNVSIMFPMISGLQELREVKAFYAQVQEELRQEGTPYHPDIPLGIMIEVPAAVIVADSLAQEVDFFSIGTNDLIQYCLGIDRTNRHVDYLYQPLHPAVVTSIKSVIDAAHQAGIEVSVCGEMAADPFCVPILMGMQVDSISLTPQAIPGIKRIIRQVTMEDCKYLLKEVLDSDAVANSNVLVKEMIFRRFPDELMFYTSLLDEK